MSYILSGSATGPFKFGTYVPADGDNLDAMSVRTAFSDAWDNMSFQDLRASWLSGSVYVISNKVNYLMATVPALSSSVQKIDSNFPYAHDINCVVDLSAMKSSNSDTTTWTLRGGFPTDDAAYWATVSNDPISIQCDLPLSIYAQSETVYIKSITAYIAGTTAPVTPTDSVVLALQVVGNGSTSATGYWAYDNTSDPYYGSVHGLTLSTSSSGTPFPNNIPINLSNRYVVCIRNDVGSGASKVYGISYVLTRTP